MKSRTLPGLLPALLGLTMVMSLALASPAAKAATAPDLVDLGVAMSATDVGATAAGPDLKGGSLLYVTAGGHPPTFTVLDAETNEVVFQKVMDGGDEFLSASTVDAVNGLTYFGLRSGSATQYYVYDVRANTVEPVVRTCRSCEIPKTVFRVFAVADDGTLYMGSYPDATVYSYNPTTKKVRDYGPVFTDGEYIWGLTLVGDQLFVGTGNGPGLGRFFQVDTVSGSITQIAFPDDATTPRVIGELQVVDDVVIVPMYDNDVVMRLYNHVTKQWVCSDVPVPGFPQPTDAFDSDTFDGRTWFRTGSEIWELEPASCSYTKVFDMADHGLAEEGFSKVKLVLTGDADDPQLSGLVLFAADGRSLLIDPATGEYEVRESNVLPSPVTTQSIGLGPDGNVYIGAFLSPHVVGQLDPESNKVTVLSGPEQADTVTTVGGRLVVTSYPNAVVHSGSLDDPWEWDSNPGLLFNGKAEEQDRVFEVVDADGLGVLGSIPKYGLLGGALTVFDPVSGDHQIYRGIVGEQSIGALAHRDGIVYGGTTLQGGAGADPDPDAEAMIFAFDLSTRTVLHSTVAVPGAKTIGGLAFGGGQLWGVTDTGVLFRTDPRARRVIETITIPGAAGNTNWGRLPDLVFNPVDGTFYGISATRQLFNFDPRTKAVHILDDEHNFKDLQVMPDGTIYLIDTTNVYLLS